MNIILIGMKACGKSTVGKLLAQKLEIKFIELDQEIEKAHLIGKKPAFAKASAGKEKLTFREIFKKHGAIYFRQLELEVLKIIFQEKRTRKFVLSCGGGTPLNEDNKEILKKLGKVFFLDVDEEVLLPRILEHGIPAFFPFQNDPEKSLNKLLEKRRPIYEKIANKIISFKSELPEELVRKILTLIN